MKDLTIPSGTKLERKRERNKNPSIYIISLTQNLRIKKFPQSPHSIKMERTVSSHKSLMPSLQS
jgi:hypothetical protein